MREAELAVMRRLGGSEENMLALQTNLANTYGDLGRIEQASQMERDVYHGRLKLNGEEHEMTLRAAFNYARTLARLKRFEEAKALLRKTMPVARRVLGESHEITLKMRCNYAAVLRDEGATLADLREGRNNTRGDGTDRAARFGWRASARLFF